MDADCRKWAVLSAVVIAVLLVPLVHGRDSFPLSTYPMFSGTRDARAKIAHVIGRRADGSGSPMSPKMLGTAEIMQASQIARNAVKDRERAADLCTRVAARVADEPDRADIVTIEVRTDEFDAIAYWEGARKPVRSRVHAQCDVRR